MAKLTTTQRKKMPDSMFAGGKKKGTKGQYPIPDKSHAIDALSRVSANGSPAMKAKVKVAVRKKFPGIKKRPPAKMAGMPWNINKKPNY